MPGVPGPQGPAGPQGPQGPAGAISDLYASTTAAQSTTSPALVPVTGLSFNLPAQSANQNFAIVTLNMPNLFLSGTPSLGTLGGEVGVLLSGETYPALGQISADVNGALADGRKPISVVVKIPLTSEIQSLQAVWSGVRNATINTDTFASMSAIMTAN